MIRSVHLCEFDLGQFHGSLLIKSRSRRIEPSIDSLGSPEVRERAKHDYHTLADELPHPLADFDESFQIIVGFYRSLPWVEP